MKLLKLALKGILISIYWNLAWKTKEPFRYFRDHSTKLWCEQQNRLVNYMGKYVSGSGWNGMNCVVDGEKYTLELKRQITH